MKPLCVIPARGGSKRIPFKNGKLFCGKPMIAWSIAAARDSGLFARVLVSTDDARIAAIAREHGAEAPFVRPAELSDDHTPIVPVVRHAMNWAVGDGWTGRHVCCLFATAPFVTAELLREGHTAMLAHPGTDFAFSAVRFSFPLFRAVRVTAEGTARMFWPEHELTRSQDLPAAYHEAGQFYWATRPALLARDGIYGERSRLVIVPAERVQDIDTEEDWARAQILALHLNHAAGAASEAARNAS